MLGNDHSPNLINPHLYVQKLKSVKKNTIVLRYNYMNIMMFPIFLLSPLPPPPIPSLLNFLTQDISKELYIYLQVRIIVRERGRDLLATDLLINWVY